MINLNHTTSQSLLMINWGTVDKKQPFIVAQKKGLKIYLATSRDYPNWVAQFVPSSQFIFTNTYNSDELITDTIAFMEQHQVEFDGITTFFEMNIIQTADLAHVLSLPFISPRAARQSSGNKLLMRQRCQSLGIPTPQYAPFKGREAGLKAITAFQSPVIIKPIRSGHSYGVVKVEGKSEAECKSNFKYQFDRARSHLDQNYDEWMKYYQPYKEDFLIEEYLEGQVVSVDGLIQDKNIIFSGVTEFEMSAEPLFLQHLTLVPSQMKPKKQNKIKKEAARILQGLEFNNCGFHCEMRLTKQGPVLLEAAARLPGGQILGAYKEAYGVDLAALYLDICLGKKINKISASPRKAVFQETIPLYKEGFIHRVEGLEELKKMKNFKLFEVCQIGDQSSIIEGVPMTALYYELSAKNYPQLKKLKQRVHQIFKVMVWEQKQQAWLSFLKKKLAKLVKFNA